MNYKKIYDSLIQKRGNFPLLKKNGYCEKHHIIPKCLGGSNKKENLINLTAREHFIAHLLLLKIYPDNNGIFFAVWRMINSDNKRKSLYKFSSRDYEKLKIKNRTTISQLLKGENHYLNKMSPEEKEKWLDENRRGGNNPSFGKGIKGPKNSCYKDMSPKKSEIIKLYCENKLDPLSIGKLYGCRAAVIIRVLKENNISIRNASEARKCLKLQPYTELSEKTKETVNLYLNQKKTLSEIGKLFGCSSGPIKRVLLESGIKIRKAKENNKLNSVKRNYTDLTNKTKEIIDLYKNQFKTLGEIGELFGCSSNPIERVLRESNIRIRTMLESRSIRYRIKKDKNQNELIEKVKHAS